MIPRRRIDIALSDLIDLFRPAPAKPNPAPETDVRRFESRFAAFVGSRYARATPSGRSAILLALDALGLRAGDEVLVPAYTLGELLGVLRSAGYVPAAVDVEPDTFNLDPKALRRKITPRTRAVLATHLLGAPCDIREIMAVSDAAGIAVVEDCAHALGAFVEGRHVGTFGAAGIFSFEVNKGVPTYGGGMVVTDRAAIDAVVAERLAILPVGRGAVRRKVLHTFVEEIFVRSPAYGPVARVLFSPRVAGWFERRYRAGHDRGRPQEAYTSFQARLGLRRLDLLADRNRRLNQRWDELAAALPPGFIPQNRDRHGRPAFYNFVALAPGAARDLRPRALRLGVDLATGGEVMDDCAALTGDPDCPVAAATFARAVMIPLYDGMRPSRFGRLIARLRTLTPASETVPPAEVVLVRVVDAAEVGRGVHPRHFAPHLTLKYIEAGLLARGRSASIVDLAIRPAPPEDVGRRILAATPRVAVLLATSAGMDTAARLAASLRAAGVITVAVGQHVHHQTASHDETWRAAFDLALNGEPEEAAPAVIVDLLDGADSRALAARWATAEPLLVGDPDALPTPVVRSTEMTDYPFPFPLTWGRINRWGYVLSAWGCPHECRHCSWATRKTFGRTWRPRQPAGVAAEVAALLAAGAEAICFEDENLFHSPAHARALFAEFERRGLRFPWIAHARPDSLDDSLVADAARAGAVLFKVGVESGSPAVIERLGKATSGVQWRREVEAGFRALDRHGIDSVAMFMIGSPDETETDVEMTVALARRIRPSYLQVHIFCPFPDTGFYQSLPADRQARAATCLYQYARPSWSPSRIPVDRLLVLQRRFYRSYYLRPAFIARHLWRCGRAYAGQRGVLTRALRSIAWVLTARDYRATVVRQR